MQPDLWREFAIALCLVFILEGVMPFLYPTRWRKLVAQLATVDDRTMRMTGLISMLIGLGLLYVIN
ncbi:DUF2065 domain-containing protein [Thalassolituus hydrocarboniclasticus]|uniref:DUF2065 domain-containing protein n=1 Tax=Thalassolituus hydrocarboniclasticus TaxID=2742796 RepID=A0ABY6A650_9GAMM|nr:DUF2065 domain-containing protein [Thalassolituus hydrocarboniclasticus]UXD86509.1 DUF2065 domain-containing protein [Thalassolituus hydrocarboniclasticus]